MRQEEIIAKLILDYMGELKGALELDYIERALLAAAKTEAEKSFIKKAFRLERARRPRLLAMKGGLTA